MVPLADRLRPQKLEEIVGQKHILAPDKLLYKSIKNNQLFSMIFWGPPGVGKTTLARVISNELGTEFYEFSAVTTGIVEIKKLIEEIKGRHSVIARSEATRQSIEEGIASPTARNDGFISPILFIDEIHRFNKAQQDALLPHVENGTITFIGATTENPSFEVIGPLLSRTRVFVLKQLEREELLELINRALKDKEKGLGKFKIEIKPEALDFLLEASNGDARVILNALEVAVTSSVIPAKAGIQINKNWIPGQARDDKRMVIDQKLLEDVFQRKSLLYDKAGEEHYNTISAFIKSMRASNVDAALYYLARMVEAGEDPLFIARRMVVFASEDVASPTALVVANAVFQACQQIGYPECQENLAAGVVYLTQAQKDRSAYDGYMSALADVKQCGNLPIPLNIRNAPTKLMKDLGYGKGYEKYTKESLLPDKLKGKKYYSKSKG